MNTKVTLGVQPWRSHARVMVHLVSFIILAIFTSMHLEVGASQNSFYVAPTGNNSNPGTISQPWKTIEYAANTTQVKPGDTVFIRGGVYNEYILQGISGQPGKPITYKNYPGETPIITGSGTWRWHILEQSHIRIEGLTFRDFQKGAIQIRARNDNITDVEVLNCIFENQSQLNNDGAKTIHITTTDSAYQVTYVTLRGNLLQNVDTGDHPAIQVAGDSHYIRILDNVVNTTTSIGIGIAGRPDIGQPTNILVKGNAITGHGSPAKYSAGVYLDGAGEKIIVEENIIYGGQQGIKVSLEPTAASLQTNHVIVRNNILYNNTQINLKLGVGDSDENCTQAGNLTESVAVHNTVFNSLDNVINNRFGCGEALRWKNNIFIDMSDGSSGSFHYKSNDNDTTHSPTWELDYNLFYTEDHDGYFRWGGSTHHSLAGFKTASGHDSHSFTGNPQFVNTDTAEFELEPDSAARDAGGGLTFTLSAGNGTVVSVEEAWYFSDGLGLQNGDVIRIGSNDPVIVVDVNYENNTLTVDKSISWQAADRVNYDFEGPAADVGALEFVPKFDLYGSPGDTEIYLTWEISEELPETAVLEIQYVGPKGSPPSPITSIPQDTNQYVLTGMKNYTFYQITLLAVVDGEIILSDTIEVMPTDIFSFLPFIAKSP
jgi:hypothetical protein